jgi:hypothetical protein
LYKQVCKGGDAEEAFKRFAACKEKCQLIQCPSLDKRSLSTVEEVRRRKLQGIVAGYAIGSFLVFVLVGNMINVMFGPKFIVAAPIVLIGLVGLVFLLKGLIASASELRLLDIKKAQ